MKLSLNWLLDHIELNQLSSNPTKISELLTILGLEVESLYNPAIALKEFLIAQVLEVKNHPNADRLKICKVDLGNKKYDVVCGASNVIENQKVVFAPIGSTIPSTGMVLKKKEIRGVMGEGMLCSEKELGVGDDYSGILELPKEAPIG
ncbi:MAG: phenylalanine--tRNA ligase subunit beta, partial [Pelagibacterales bacterium]|nr:phenylalanine--tRNA ligase subunit beta [Pelagibacterales bacterium]